MDLQSLQSQASRQNNLFHFFRWYLNGNFYSSNKKYIVLYILAKECRLKAQEMNMRHQQEGFEAGERVLDQFETSNEDDTKEQENFEEEQTLIPPKVSKYSRFANSNKEQGALVFHPGKRSYLDEGKTGQNEASLNSQLSSHNSIQEKLFPLPLPNLVEPLTSFEPPPKNAKPADADDLSLTQQDIDNLDILH